MSVSHTNVAYGSKPSDVLCPHRDLLTVYFSFTYLQRINSYIVAICLVSKTTNLAACFVHAIFAISEHSEPNAVLKFTSGSEIAKIGKICIKLDKTSNQ